MHMQMEASSTGMIPRRPNDVFGVLRLYGSGDASAFDGGLGACGRSQLRSPAGDQLHYALRSDWTGTPDFQS
jgi:hypothetical protein